MIPRKTLQQRSQLAWTLRVALLFAVCGCASRRETLTSGKLSENWNLGEIRNAVTEVLNYYGPVNRASRERFQSSRIPTNHLANLGEEFTLVTVKVEASFPHRIYVTSEVFVEQTGRGFKKTGTYPEMEQKILVDIRRVLSELFPGGP